MAKKLKIKQIRSTINRLKNHKLTIKALGLRHIGHSVIQNDNDCVRGMIKTVEGLVEVEEIQG